MGTGGPAAPTLGDKPLGRGGGEGDSKAASVRLRGKIGGGGGGGKKKR